MVDRSPSAQDRRSSAPPKRRAKGFLRAADLTPTALKQTGAKRGFAELRLLTEWRTIVGEALAGICQPVRTSYRGKTASLGATLVITTEGARAPEVEMQTPRIIERVNQFYGYRAVSRLRIDQSRSGHGPVGGTDRMTGAEHGAGFAEAPAHFGTVTADTRAAGDPLSGDIVPLEGVTDDRLRLALGRLGANIKRSSAQRAPKDTTRRDRS